MQAHMFPIQRSIETITHIMLLYRTNRIAIYGTYEKYTIVAGCIGICPIPIWKFIPGLPMLLILLMLFMLPI